jgi:DNA primase
MNNPILTPRDVAERYNRCMPEEVRQYLKSQGLAATIIDRQLLGWNGTHVTIPVFSDSLRDVVGFAYAALPADPANRPDIVFTEVSTPVLYGRETLARKPHRVVICEGLFDRLLLEARGFPAVTSTAGADAFLPEWKVAFEDIADVFICFRPRASSEAAARNVQQVLPSSRIATLPADVGENGSITDFFLHALRTNRDFEVVLAGASGHAAGPSKAIKRSRSADASQERRAERLRSRVRLHDVVFAYANLQASGGRLVGHCPFHDDGSRSFSVYAETDSYSCSVCGAAGDVVMFLMNKGSMTFGQALEALERFEVTGTLR